MLLKTITYLGGDVFRTRWLGVPATRRSSHGVGDMLGSGDWCHAVLCPGTSLHPWHGLIAVLVRDRLRTHGYRTHGCTRRNHMRDGRANRDSYRRTRQADEHADERSSPGNCQENGDSQQEAYLPSAVSPREPWIEHEVTPKSHFFCARTPYRRLRIGSFMHQTCHRLARFQTRRKPRLLQAPTNPPAVGISGAVPP